MASAIFFVPFSNCGNSKTPTGPSTDHDQVLEKIIKLGVDIVRMNFSHGTEADHRRRVKETRACAEALGKEVGILADLQGPKLRITRFKENKVTLIPGAEFVLDAALDDEAGTVNSVGIDYKELPNDLSEGDKIHTTVKIGGFLSNNKGINRLGGGLSAQTLTEKDKHDLKIAVELGVDYIAVSFPRSAADIEHARSLLVELKCDAGIIAKIERQEAVEAIEEIIEASDGVMVARGDLGVEIGDAELPEVQKRIIHTARSLNKAVITATQMMETMIHNSIPTRAEVFDVANAILDGTDAIMLSAETATGDHPDKVIEAAVRICLGAEKHPRTQRSSHRASSEFSRVDEAIAMATMYTANHLGIKAIIALTESGYTPLWMSRIRSGIPIYGLCRHKLTQRKMTLFRGVYPLEFDITKLTRDQVNREAIKVLESRELVQKGDLVIITKGDLMGEHGGTNAMKIIRVGEEL